MDSKIDFTLYTLEELESAAEFIDSDEYPERAKEINRLIQEKSVTNLEKTSNTKEIDNTKRVGGKATRGDRFISALIDGLIGMVASIPIFMYVDLAELAEPSFLLGLSLLGYGLVLSFILHGYLLYHYGQTIGKNFMSIRIENLDDTKAELSTIYLKRILPMQVVSIIPFGGQFIAGIVNPLFIFGKEKRCVHDYIAKTKVCYTNN
jgi:uncharacterized RDD family membrane protein YckC